MAILVDTSVWVEHFKNRNERLIQLLNQDMVLIHPMIVAEIACGTPPSPRKRTLDDLELLPQSSQASLTEVIAFIEDKALYGLGCGLVDITLLASTLLTPGTRIWTLDKRLRKMAERFNIQYQISH